MEKFIVTHEENGILVAESTQTIKREKRANALALYFCIVLNPITIAFVVSLFLTVYVFSSIY